MTTTVLASGSGWRISEANCTSGPGDPVSEEQHSAVCLAVVLDGTFSYRSPQGRAALAPGAILLGNAGDCFVCGHEHSKGDRCLSFQFNPEYFEQIVAEIPGATQTRFAGPCLAPGDATTRLTAIAEAAVGDPEALEEIMLAFAASVAAHLAGSTRTISRHARSAHRIAEILHLIEMDAADRLPLTRLAREAAMSPYQFLREFRHQFGITPHQYILARRLRQAALRLRETSETVLSVALDCGFSDVSEFNRRFKRIVGLSPTAYRAKYSIRGVECERNCQ